MKILVAFLFLSNICFSQTTITFRDDVKLTVKGEKVGNFIEYDYDDPTLERKLVEYFFFKNGDSITISIYTTWLKENLKGQFDELQVYSFHPNQFELAPKFSEKTDDANQFLNYRLTILAKDEQLYSYDRYNLYSSKPAESKQSKNLTFYLLDKTKFEAVLNEYILKFNEENKEE